MELETGGAFNFCFGGQQHTDEMSQSTLKELSDFLVPSSFVFLLGTLYFKLILLLVDLLKGSAPVTCIENLTPDFSASK